MSQLKLYFDLLSPPARCVYLFCKVANIQVIPYPVALRKMEQKRPEYVANVNPFGTVPAIDHDGFVLTESLAILQYLCREYSVNDHWYPHESQRRARLDEYLSWNHFNTRYHCGSYFLTKWLNPIKTGAAVDLVKLAACETDVRKTLDQLNSVWLGRRRFLGGGDEISIADLVAVCELEQAMMLQFDALAGRSNLQKWYHGVKSHCGIHYDEAHAVCYRINKKFV